MLKSKILILMFVGITFNLTYAQKLPDIRINGNLCCNLDDIFVFLSNKYKLKFNYDKERMEKIEFVETAYRLKLSKFMERACKYNELRYFVGKDSVINIVDRWKDAEELDYKEEKEYSGKATKFDFTLSGKIIDSKTRESLPFVNIGIRGETIGTSSNVDGYFKLIDVPSDTSTIYFSYIGYQPTELFLTPETDPENILVEMETSVIKLNEVKVTAENTELLQVSDDKVSMIKMSPVNLHTLPNLGEKDILRSMQLMPGISAVNENSSGLYVRGGTPDQSLVLYDGFAVYNVEHLFGFFSAFNSNTIKDVQMFKGGFDAKYGGRLSSVAQITGKEGNQNNFNLCADLSLMSVNGFVEFPVGDKITAIFGIRRSWESPLYTKIFEQFSEDNEQPQMGRFGSSDNQSTSTYFYDMNAKVTYRPSQDDIITFSMYNGEDYLDNSLTPPSNSPFGGVSLSMETIDLTNWGNTGMSLKWSRNFSDRLYMNTLISYSNYFSLRDRSSAGSFVRRDGEGGDINRNTNEDNNLDDYTAKTDFIYNLSDNNQLEFGLQATYNDINYTYTQSDTLTIIDRSTQGNIYNAYLQNKISMLDGTLAFTPGLRYNYFTGTNKSYYEPRFSAVYHLGDHLKLKGSAGLYYQFAKRVIREDIEQGSRDFWVLSDDNKLPVSSSTQYIAGFSYETLDYLFDVEGYYKNLDNITEYSLRIDPRDRDLGYEENFFTGTGIAKGIEFLAQKKQGDLTGWVSYTLGRVTNRIEEFGDYDFYAANDVTHEFKVVSLYNLKHWTFGATWIFATGRPYTVPEGGYELTLLDGSTKGYINPSIKNGHRLPNYHRLDLSVNYNFLFNKSVPISLGFSLFNAYNRANVWYNEYEIVDNEIIETPVNFLGISPNINITIKLH